MARLLDGTLTNLVDAEIQGVKRTPPAIGKGHSFYRRSERNAVSDVHCVVHDH